MFKGPVVLVFAILVFSSTRVWSGEREVHLTCDRAEIILKLDEGVMVWKDRPDVIWAKLVEDDHFYHILNLAGVESSNSHYENRFKINKISRDFIFQVGIGLNGDWPDKPLYRVWRESRGRCLRH